MVLVRACAPARSARAAPVGRAIFHRPEKASHSKEFAASPVTAALHRGGMIAGMLGADRGVPQAGGGTIVKGCAAPVCRVDCVGLQQLVGSDAVRLRQRPIRASPVAAYRLPRWRAAAGLAHSARGAGPARGPSNFTRASWAPASGLGLRGGMGNASCRQRHQPRAWRDSLSSNRHKPRCRVPPHKTVEAWRC